MGGEAISLLLVGELGHLQSLSVFQCSTNSLQIDFIFYKKKFNGLTVKSS
jgi:hypothetical protein